MAKELADSILSGTSQDQDFGFDSHCAAVHVLAVDDSILDRKVIEKLFHTSSCKVTTVESGNKALEVLGIDGSCNNSVRIDISLIITDYSMPGMTGYDLLRRVKGISALKDIPVVIMSSENVPNQIQRCLEEGAEEFIMKPVRMADVQRLTEHLRTPSSTHCEADCGVSCSIKREIEWHHDDKEGGYLESQCSSSGQASLPSIKKFSF